MVVLAFELILNLFGCEVADRAMIIVGIAIWWWCYYLRLCGVVDVMEERIGDGRLGLSFALFGRQPLFIVSAHHFCFRLVRFFHYETDTSEWMARS